MTFREDLLPDIDGIRCIPDDLGIRLYTVTLRMTTWTGDDSAIGLGRGIRTDVETPITLANGQRPKVRRISYKETVAGGGKYQEGDFKIGPFTPEYVGGGVSFAKMAPPPTGGGNKGYHFVLRGPDLPATGLLCEPIEEQADRAFSRYLVVRPSGSSA
jgi:hypothetical protein